ncbi:MAG TPA: hypothetical protein DEF45_12285, partial [Rhodopirellula sp.]|nr:hypothetical protein [Rhodopirellula sp.]
IELDAASEAGFDVTFTVFGADAADSAFATKTNAGGAELLRFDRSDFYGTQTGLFDTTPIPGKAASQSSILTWSDVYAYAISVDGAGAGGTFQMNEVYATIPEPSSMLAMAGLFGGAGILRFRRRRSAKKTAEA